MWCLNISDQNLKWPNGVLCIFSFSLKVQLQFCAENDSEGCSVIVSFAHRNYWLAILQWDWLKWKRTHSHQKYALYILFEIIILLKLHVVRTFIHFLQTKKWFKRFIKDHECANLNLTCIGIIRTRVFPFLQNGLEKRLNPFSFN